MEIPSFYEWVIDRYLNSNSEEGTFASDIATDEGFPKTEVDCQTIIRHLVQKNACPATIEIFKDCWCEYMGSVDRIRYKDE
jgi:uncharacterized protein YozE (UPF0346 family)